MSWPLRTECLELRRCTPENEEALWAYRQLPEVSRWLTLHAADRADFAALLSTRWQDMVVVELGGIVGGDLMLKVEDAWAQREVRAAARGVQAELGYTFDPAHTGHGYATEAVTKLLRVSFQDLRLRRVVANAFAANEPSWRLMERLGMRRELHSVAESLHRDLGWLDGVGCALLAEEWRGAGPSPTG